MIQHYLPPKVTYVSGVHGANSGVPVVVPMRSIGIKPRRALNRGRIVYTTRLPAQPKIPYPAGATHSAVESFWNEDL